MKWLDSPSTDNSWVSIDDCTCDDKIDDYENLEIVGILGERLYLFYCESVEKNFLFFILLFFQIGFKKTYISVKYAVVKKGARDFTLIDSSEMLQRYPLELFEFLKYRVELLVTY